MRERDVRDAIMAALSATGEFDAVSTGKEGGNEITPDGRSFAHVDLHDARDTERWDSGGNDGAVVFSACKITLSFWEEDVLARDARLEKLSNVARNILNNQSLAELTIPAFSRFHTWRWLPAESPIRSIEGIFRFRYVIDSLQEFGTEE